MTSGTTSTGPAPLRRLPEHVQERLARHSPELDADLADLTSPLEPGEHGLHRAARIEDALKGFLGGRLRARGWRSRVLAYPGYGGPGWVRVMGRVLLSQRPTSPLRQESAAERAVRGWRNFMTVPVAGASVVVQFPGAPGVPPRVLTTDRGGYVDERIEVDLPPGVHQVHLSLARRGGERRGGAHRFDAAPESSGEAAVIVVGPEPVRGLLSDIDDTVVVTRLPRPLLAAWNTFVLTEKARVPVPGMAELYHELLARHDGAPVVYLSTGAWNAAPALIRFLDRSGYPPGPLLLTDWGPTNTGWFRDGSTHKRTTLERLVEELPNVTWLLVGDDGQHDPAIYGDFAAAHPEKVAAVAIRRLTPTEKLLASGLSPTEPLSVPAGAESVTRVSGGDGFELMHRLRGAGVLDDC
ncbi:phosphatidate phosphatase APP1 [Kineococcus xinjiangensis]|uniref:Phosphatidate phosphatase APP1 n=1 Tax=Kineococcus xinjiangensis TaxID=512762 RepID=A0A2S6IK11_9ACTN|nr:phosphatase domain-containing protein [Kineococcus xinjiangensis]PPK94538.1 phosphatidate phosphatase APP1 [Kineococcus xinjiangensis]